MKSSCPPSPALLPFLPSTGVSEVSQEECLSVPGRQAGSLLPVAAEE